MALSDNLKQRLVSATVILPVVILLLTLDWPWILVWVVPTILLMGREALLVSRDHWRLRFFSLAYVIVGGGVFVALGSYGDNAGVMRYWIAATAVSADILAYVFGRLLGGPKLWPAISPNKTWVGLCGAIIGASLAGVVVRWAAFGDFSWLFAAFCGFLGVVEQGADLLESAFKRHCGVKDTGAIIPGHGGVMDRLDGVFGVVLFLAPLYVIWGDALWMRW